MFVINASFFKTDTLKSPSATSLNPCAQEFVPSSGISPVSSGVSEPSKTPESSLDKPARGSTADNLKADTVDPISKSMKQQESECVEDTIKVKTDSTNGMLISAHGLYVLLNIANKYLCSKNCVQLLPRSK